MFLLASYLSTDFDQLKRHWARHSVLMSEGKRGSDKPFVKRLGGRIDIIDWATKKIAWSMTVECPTGTYRASNDLLMANTLRSGAILAISLSQKAILTTIDNDLFNKPHSLVKTSSGWMVASTGTDAIVEVDSSGKTIYSFLFTEHGYKSDQLGGERIVDRETKHQGVEYPSLHQTTHVNYCRYVDEKESKIVATLFHPGELVLIDKEADTIQVVLRGLKNPHNLKDAGAGRHLLCNTSANTIMVLNDQLELTQELGADLGMSWVQDAIHCQKDDTIFAADADNHRILQLDWSGKIIDTYDFSADDRVYEVSVFE
jgi:hypothetical protein